MDQERGSAHLLEFGRYRLVPVRRELHVDGVPTELGGRAFDVLLALIEAGGTVLSKEDLLSRVWPGRIVEENNLQVQIVALRKALGDDRDLIRTVAGRGYQFTGQVRPVSAPAVSAAAEPAVTSNLPSAVGDLIGRDHEVSTVRDLVVAHRMVTLIGAGGIGKTRLSVEVAQRVRSRFPDGVWIAELGPLSDPDLVPVTVATALGLTFGAGVLSAERVAAALGSQQLLLILDNCEHVIDAAARMAEALLRSGSVRVLATSRELLRVPGEAVYRVPALDVPAAGVDDSEALLRAGAVQLFVARARAAQPQFSADAHTIAVSAAICRRLDGIPLAIELAASRAAALGVETLAARLDDRFKLLTRGHRTALPRQQTLRATLDWSYDLLSESERLVLRRLAIFSGSFTLESASAVAAGGGITSADVLDCVVSLVAKSLVAADIGRAVARYRLLETTRAYGLELLAASGELQQFALRHAQYQCEIFEQAAIEWEQQPAGEWLDSYAWQIDNVRAALDWAFSPGGEVAIGVALTVAAVPLWFQLALLEECRMRVERALAGLAVTSGSGTRTEMRLYAALGLSMFHTKGPLLETNIAWTRALDIAQQLGDDEYRLQAMWGLWAYQLTAGENRTALTLAQKFRNLAASKPDVPATLMGDRMIANVLHNIGRQSDARAHLERVLSRYSEPPRRTHTMSFMLDQRASASAILARILWLQGLPDQAVREARAAVEEGSRVGGALSLCYALALAECPIALLVGDMAALERSVQVLADQSTRHALLFWQAWAACFQGYLLAQRGDPAGQPMMRAALEDLREIGFGRSYTARLGNLAEVLAGSGAIAEGLAVIDEALERTERHEESWCNAELLRVKARLILLEGGVNARAAAEALLDKGLELAREQGALSWELRCATSLARLWQEQGETGRARELLTGVYGQFTEGFATADLLEAKAVLDALH